LTPYDRAGEEVAGGPTSIRAEAVVEEQNFGSQTIRRDMAMLQGGKGSRRAPEWIRRMLLAAFVLVIASCSGGGCGSGCGACGTTPLPGGFPKASTIPNAASMRVTRPGLTFLQENLTTLAERALDANATGGVATFAIPKSSQSNVNICTPASPVPPQCLAEVGVGAAKLRINAITPNRVKLDGALPVRIRDLPISVFGVPGYVVAGDAAQAPGGNLCTASLRGAESFPYKEFPLNVELPLVTETRAPRDGYTKVDIENAIIDIGITENDVEICATCTVLQSLCQGAFNFAKRFAFDSLVNGVKDQIRDALSAAFCTAPTPTVSPTCPNGSEPDDPDPSKATRCVFTGTDECVPSLLGADGRMNLGRALAAFSPGSQGGLDFVLASAGDMNPAPGAAGVPPWTPRTPAVPAEDNNANGLSLTMLGGALPQPKTNCVEVAANPPPTGIPVPTELLGDTVSPWPAQTPGPHVGVAIAGRFLDHAVVSAYNSGALCLGVSTEQLDQLNSGYLSLIVPSLKTLTFEHAPAAAAITTRPGVPPKIILGGGTDTNTDPLLRIVLEKLAVDFYVFSHDRFVRVFTYTADVTVPVDLQTGKSADNPNGGLLPVIGDLVIENPSVTNNELIFEDGGLISGAVTGLLGGIVGQFLGGGFSPIDLAGALEGFGIGLEIPAGGIRKLRSGSDDFLAVFANLQAKGAAAHEEADTRAVLLEKIVDAEAMTLATAERVRFPRLRVAVEGIASRPTEHTFWIDRGPRARWTTAREIVVDQDAMLLQGKHVLYVASRVVDDVGSEDATPAAIPFVIDTLPPEVAIDRDGQTVTVRAWDYVSSEADLVVRHRAAGGAFSEWSQLASGGSFEVAEGTEVEIEVKDEEGNVGRVSLPLRGRADATLAGSGSGCGCVAAGGGSPGSAPLLGGLALAALLAVARRRARGQGAPAA
jgi:hypothetical protein